MALFETAPPVDYADEDELLALHSAATRRYGALIARTLRQQVTPTRTPARALAWTPAEAVSMGLADFSALHALGPAVLLRLTKGCGLRFVLLLNDAIVTAVTACCRTFFSVLSVRWMCGCAAADSPIPAQALAQVSGLMHCAMLDAVGHLHEPRGFMRALHRRNFAWCSVFDLRIEFLPRRRVPEDQLAFAAVTHPRLGRDAAGLALTGDAVRLILAAIEFH